MEQLRQNTNYGEGQGTVFGFLYLDIVRPSFYHMMAAAYWKNGCVLSNVLYDSCSLLRFNR